MTVSSRSVRKSTHKVSPMTLPNISGKGTAIDMLKLKVKILGNLALHKTSRQLMNAENGKSSLPEGRAHPIKWSTLKHPHTQTHTH